ncbi:hypothetical protein CSA_021612 [Cucumis sativus]|uniref:Uncharacterized protein n=1 Tax=Cucumis sativus TaxID=3659 RepID=A0ACB6HBY8_CUCSA|nr:hypothetical protein CSA_021612 [Cucumis sativus]
MMAIKRSNCFHKSGGKNPCHMNSNPYMISFGIMEIFLSQIPDFDQLWWLSIVAAVMSFTYSIIGLVLGIIQVTDNGKFKGSLTGVSIGSVTESQKIWRSFQALGDMAFAYSFPLSSLKFSFACSRSVDFVLMLLLESSKCSSDNGFLHALWLLGYAAFGDLAPGNLLTGFGFYNPYWLLDIANVAIVVHLVGAYQASLEDNLCDHHHPCLDAPPFFNDIVGLLGALGFWPLTVYLPVEMYIAQKKSQNGAQDGLASKFLAWLAL